MSASQRHHTSTVENYIPRTSPGRQFVTHHQPAPAPVPAPVVSATTSHHDTYIPRSTYDRSMVSNTRVSPGRPTNTILSRYSPRQQQLETTTHHHVEHQQTLPDSHSTTHTAPGLNFNQNTNTRRGLVADSTALEEVTKVTHERVDQTNVHTDVQFQHQLNGSNQLKTSTNVSHHSNALNGRRNRVRFEEDKLPDLDYDSPSRYARAKSPVYSPRSKKSLVQVSEDGLTHTFTSRSVTHDLSRVPVP